jgi:type I restriction enzyme S subunit
MKPEIKERVERIRKGGVPEGYKETKVGIIPDDWLVSLTDNVAKRGTGHTPNKKFASYYDGGIKWISLQDSNKLDNGLIFHTKVEISEEGLSNSSAVLHSKGSVLISRDAGVGKSAIMGNDMSVSQHFITWTCSNRLNNWYLYYYLQKQKSEFERMAVGSTIKTIGMPFFKKYKIPLPPIKEQKKIAKILSTWDKAIELKEKLIEEKKEFKRGLVQKLLTGEMRFPEFTGEWEETRLGKKLTFIKKESIENPQNYRLLKVKLHLKGIEATENYPKSTENGRPYHLRCEGELLIGRQNFHNGGIGIIPKGMNGYITSNAISSLKSSDDNLMHYYYYLCNPNFYKKVGYLIGGTGQKEISESMFKNLKMTLPSNDEEIKKISGTIKTICQDLEMENNILSQLKEQKRGLMQLLLTGIVRVEVD